ncbi:hypothetical protein [Pseudomonas moorei]|uniref:hypothetical protein n=1 Tax=Pseudomonas moorei TaxID=395599 RepID=UPI00200F85F7|nr:hypothetical protein [Pseudomonas moorei]
MLIGIRRKHLHFVHFAELHFSAPDMMGADGISELQLSMSDVHPSWKSLRRRHQYRSARLIDLDSFEEVKNRLE